MSASESEMTMPESPTAAPPSTPSPSARWSKTIAALHWASAAFIVALVIAGSTMSDLDSHSSLRLWLSRGHTVGGVSLVVLTAFRLWRSRRPDRPAPLDVPALHRRGIGVIHGLIYATIFGLGVTGLTTAKTSSHWHEYLLGEIAGAPDMTHVAARGVHAALVTVLLIVVGLHVGGVLLNEWRNGGTLRRMLPGRKPR